MKVLGLGFEAASVRRPLGVATAAAQALAAANPCDQANARLVCDFQKSVGQSPDGKYGTDTAHALSARVVNAPQGCHPRPAWWSGHGQSNCGGGGAMTQGYGNRYEFPATPYPVTQGESPATIAQRLGVPFDVLIAANPHKPVVTVAGVPTWVSLVAGEVLNAPVPGTVGANEGTAHTDGVSTASGSVPGESVPDAPAGTRSPVAFQRTTPSSPGEGIVPGAGTRVSGTTATFTDPAAMIHSPTQANLGPATALAAVNPCEQANVGLVSAFQQSVGQTPDGKYGTDTAKALAAKVPGAPGGCQPRPAWWAPSGQRNVPGGAVVSPPPPVVAAQRQPPPPPPIAAPIARRYVAPPSPFVPPYRYVAPPAYSNVPPPVPLESPFSQRHYVRMASQYGETEVPPPPPVTSTDTPPAAPATTTPPPSAPPSPATEERPGMSKEAIIAGGVAAVALVAILGAVASSSGSPKKSEPSKATERKRRR